MTGATVPAVGAFLAAPAADGPEGVVTATVVPDRTWSVEAPPWALMRFM
ncbi:hypothetical protein [Streptomyces sp. NPDC093260]